MTKIWRWILLVVGIPILFWALDRLGERIERRRAGPSPTTRALRAPRRVRTRLRA